MAGVDQSLVYDFSRSFVRFFDIVIKIYAQDREHLQKKMHKMWSTVEVFGIFLVLMTHHETSAQDNFCPNTRVGGVRCISLESCKPLIEYLDMTNGRNKIQFLGRSLCASVAHNNGVLKICCPTEFNFGNVNNNNNYNDNYYDNNKDDYNNNKNNDRNNRPSNPSNVNLNNRPSTSRNYGPLYPPTCGFTDVKFTRVVNGVPAALGAWPWATLLGYRTKNPSKPNYLCGGALISARHVLTAAHCVYNRNDLYVVRVGELDIEDDYDGAAPINLLIERKTIHPQYIADSLTNDIAILRVNEDIQFTDLIKPICLPVTEDIQSVNLTNVWPFIVGWGELGYQTVSASLLQQVQLPIVEESLCKTAYRGKHVLIDERVLCAGGLTRGGQNSCQGDSGGPMMYPINKSWYSIGIISFGFKCALPGYPSVYTRTQYFLDFILQNLY